MTKAASSTALLTDILAGLQAPPLIGEARLRQPAAGASGPSAIPMAEAWPPMMTCWPPPPRLAALTVPRKPSVQRIWFPSLATPMGLIPPMMACAPVPSRLARMITSSSLLPSAPLLAQ